MKIGLILPHWSGSMAGHTPTATETLAFGREAQQVGVDSLWLTDHLYHEPFLDFLDHGYQLPTEHRGVRVGFWESWTTLAALAVDTADVEIGTLVTNTAFRNPALLASMAATVDSLSKGRLTVGLGAGDFRSEHMFHGYPWERRIGRFEEALRIIVPMLRGERVTVDGDFYQSQDVELLPEGPRKNGPPVLIGSMRGGPRMKRLTVQYGDGWSCWLAFEDSHVENYAARLQGMQEACEQHGRDPETLAGNVTIGITLPGLDGLVPGASPITGSANDVAEQISRYAELDVDRLTVYLHPCNEAGLEWLGEILSQVQRRSTVKAAH